MKTFDILKERGYIYQCSNLEEVIENLNSDEKVTFYIGIDPTADSLHIGHFFALTMVRRMQDMGHKAIVVVGGATALIGDPTGKTNMRKILTKEQVEHNKKEVKELIKRFVKIDGDNSAIILDNSDWINAETYIDFMRNVGVHFNVNTMLNTDCYKNRLKEGGLTFLEMGYMLMQAYDFVYLNKNYGCTLQVGGSDQWANIIAGVELSRKLDFMNNVERKIINGLTCPLLLKADGEKMGKTSSGTLWVSRDKTTVFDFYQMFINSFDEDVERLLSFFSDIDMNGIKNMCEKDIVNAKKLMAFEVTKLVHGEAEAFKAKKTSEEIFSKGINSDSMPSIEISKEKIFNSDLFELLNLSLNISKSEARRLSEQGGIKVNNEKEFINREMSKEDIIDGAIIIQKGNKVFLRINLK